MGEKRKGGMIGGAIAIVLGAGLLGLVGCAAVNLPNVPLAADADPREAIPPALAAFEGDRPVTNAEEWVARRAPLLRAAFAAHIYGAMPLPAPVTEVSRRTLVEAAFDGAALIEELIFHVGEGPAQRTVHVGLLIPRDASGPVPLIVMQTFCGVDAVLWDMDMAAPSVPAPEPCKSAWMRPVDSAIYGAALMSPPFEEMMDRGYAVAVVYPAEIAPDGAATAEPALASLTPPGTPPDQRTGAIAAWAWGYSRVLDGLQDDPRIDPARTAIWGHSRHGKAALLAAAHDPRIEAVITLQSGTGGASLTRDKVGETVGQMTKAYPHWFAPAYAGFAGREAELPVDQHLLLALIAPRSILIGAARRDRWSDPHGAFHAATAAEPVYALFGTPGFVQASLTEPGEEGRIAYYMRSGLHGVHNSDWARTLDFLDRAFASKPPSLPAIPAR